MGCVKLYWWNSHPNFGDELSRIIVEGVSGKPAIWCRPETACLFAIGSLFNIMRKRRVAGNNSAPNVWGTGTSVVLPDLEFVRDLNICAVRGPITRKLLNIECNVYGDPALLTPLFLPSSSRVEGKIGIVPHIGHNLDSSLKADLLAHPDFVLIDATSSVPTVIQQITQCEHIFSSSLHGIIVADAYGIPNTWLQRPDHNLPRGCLKFLDYFASVKRPAKSLPSKNVGLYRLSEIASQSKDLALRTVVEEIQGNLLNNLPKFSEDPV